MTSLSAADRLQLEQSIRHKAQRRVRARLGLYWHAGVFALANAAMVAINLHYSPQHSWFIWPLAGWGVALLLHGVATLQAGGVSEAMLQAEIAREMQRRGLS